MNPQTNLPTLDKEFFYRHEFQSPAILLLTNRVSYPDISYSGIVVLEGGRIFSLCHELTHFLTVEYRADHI